LGLEPVWGNKRATQQVQAALLFDEPARKDNIFDPKAYGTISEASE